MAIKRLPDIGYIRECVDYEPGTGVFIWHERPSHHFPHPKARIWWNIKFAGKVAGSSSGDRSNYWRLCFGRVTVKAHRVAWLLVHGEPIPDIIDHIDGNPLNNQIVNLRAVTNTENSANSKKRSRPTASGVRGVSFRQRGNCRQFVPYININGKRRTLGSFATLEEAASVRQSVATMLYGEFVRHE